MAGTSSRASAVENFTVILPKTSLAETARLAENVRSFCADEAQSGNSGKDLGIITVSIGVACFPGDESPEEFTHLSDWAL